MGRPRQEHVSKWGHYKRNQREISLDGVKCCRCPHPATDRHHIDGNPFHNEPANLMFMCRSCHTREDNMNRRHTRIT